MEVCCEVFLEEDGISAMSSLTNPILIPLPSVRGPLVMTMISTVENQSLSVNTARNSGIPRSNVGTT